MVCRKERMVVLRGHVRDASFLPEVSSTSVVGYPAYTSLRGAGQVSSHLRRLPGVDRGHPMLLSSVSLECDMEYLLLYNIPLYYFTIGVV